MLLLNPGQVLRAAVLVAFCLLPGCNRVDEVTVTGAVLKNGQPIPLSKTGILQVTLQPVVGPEENFTSKIAECDSTGKFQVEKVRPGKYRIGVEQFDPNPQTDKLNSAFRAESGKIVREIDGKAPLTIDLAKPGQ